MECATAAARALRPDGIYALNVADGAPLAYAKEQVSTLLAVFPQCAMIGEPAVLRGRRFGNLVLAGSRRELPDAGLRRAVAADPFPARLVSGPDLVKFAGGARPSTDATARPSPAARVTRSPACRVPDIPNMARMSEDRELDVVLFGATGFAGKLVAGYLAGHAPPGVRIGLAGRSAERLAQVQAGLGAAASAWPLLTADSGDPRSLAALARSARVVATTVGPYYRQGLPLVEACASAGTDYADLAGEVLFLRESIGRCQELAQSTGARIVHCCGFDSIPSDLGVLSLHQAVRGDDAGDLEDTTLVVTALRGGVSGGTLAAMTGQLDEVRASAGHRRAAGDPYAISPDRAAEPRLGDERDLYRVRYQGDLGIWTGPFVMAGINTRVVRRSNAVQDWAYGRRFRYREVTGFGRGPAGPVRAIAVTGGLMALTPGWRSARPGRCSAACCPAPAKVPVEKTRQAGFFRMEIHTRTSAGVRYRARVEARGDPGYAATSVMFGESALCLALDRDRLPGRAGVLTPATAMGGVLTGRLVKAGLTLTAGRITQ